MKNSSMARAKRMWPRVTMLRFIVGPLTVVLMLGTTTVAEAAGVTNTGITLSNCEDSQCAQMGGIIRIETWMEDNNGGDGRYLHRIASDIMIRPGVCLLQGWLVTATVTNGEFVLVNTRRTFRAEESCGDIGVLD